MLRIHYQSESAGVEREFSISLYHMRRLLVVLALFLVTACKPAKESQDTEISLFHETYRPQFHFSPPSGWMNDPNGMVYYDGEYHLFYQHYPDSTVWGPMHWGHAISKDLIHWEHLPIALYPDSLGYIFSGSAVVDWKNSSGLGQEGVPPLVAIFTYHDPIAAQKNHNDFQTQGIAYSLDKGRTWKKYEHNPVLPNPGIIDFRDPKVSWSELINQWVMALAVKDHIEFYSSANLKTWEKLSEFGKELGAHGGVWECPDLFPLKDESGNIKWVLFVSINPGGPQGGSATQYFVGDFDGQKFIPQDTLTRWIDHGPDNYAGVTWSDIPPGDGRRLFLGWMSNWAYGQAVPTETWRSAMTLPREITLIKNKNTWELKFAPVRELKNIEGNPQHFADSTGLDNPLAKISFDVSDSSQSFTLTMSNNMSEKIIISLNQGVLSFDRRTSGVTSFSINFPAIHALNVSDIIVRTLDIYVDAASVEVFINGGERVLTEIVFPTAPYNTVHLVKVDPQFTVSSISSIWRQN
ncbi:MAG TPA: glycoside hydrolase family 32 protein [Cyclobacteriaceae bacterium]|nr:glycoside hydrolase family 32 protein [Cyclobacteriaceae bacterium]